VAKLVFCEDNESIRKLITIAMRDSGHRVRLAEDGESGLALIRAERPDLLVTDLAMPRLDGLQLHDAIRADPALSALPIVFLTASNHHALMATARERFPLAILTKPFSPAELRARLEELLAVSMGAAVPAGPTPGLILASGSGVIHGS
jgi:DNA-binding response OmpR family regulator